MSNRPPMNHALVAALCAVFGLAYYYATTGDSAAAIVWGGAGMAWSAFTLLRVAIGEEQR